ncbi:prospero homeobox protein 1a isoform X2 [Tachysurus ichikawai]
MATQFGELKWQLQSRYLCTAKAVIRQKDKLYSSAVNLPAPPQISQICNSQMSCTRTVELRVKRSMKNTTQTEQSVPERFLEVAQITLREFFNAIVAGKDVDPSWKKAIYKVICKLDSEVPEIFKSPNCLQELLHD